MEPRKRQDREPSTARDVRAMYEAFPYPSPVVGDSLIEDLANSIHSLFGHDSLTGKRILDAGCGTGHRLIAAARRYPAAHFVGVDMTTASLEVARSLARKHGVVNVELHRANLLDYKPHSAFDVIVSTGVIHHFEDPGRGLAALAACLADRGIIGIWHYHALGEHQRLLDRELLRHLWDPTSGFDQGLKLLQGLGLKLETHRYGTSSGQAKREINQLSLDVDAYLHPIVNAYRFEEAIAMFRDSAQLEWSAINNVNLVNASKLVDLQEVETGDLRLLCQTVDELFEADWLRQRYRQLNLLDRLRVLEIKLRPTGFMIVGGRGVSYRNLRPRVQGNVIVA